MLFYIYIFNITVYLELQVYFSNRLYAKASLLSLAWTPVIAWFVPIESRNYFHRGYSSSLFVKSICEI